MYSVNRVTLIGNIGSEPECQTTGGGKFLAKFSVATSYGKDAPTQWHRITCWEKTAEIVSRHVHKGDRIYLEGRIEYRKHEDKYYTDIIADRVLLLGGKQSDSPFD